MEYVKITHISIPIGLRACPSFSHAEREIIQHILHLSNKYIKQGGCTLSNAELALSHGTTENAITRAISKALRLGFVVHREDKNYEVSDKVWKTERVLHLAVPAEWDLIGEMYCLARYNPKHEQHPVAKEFIEKIDNMFKDNPNTDRKEVLHFIDSALRGDMLKECMGGMQNCIGGICKNVEPIILKELYENNSNSSSYKGVSGETPSNTPVDEPEQEAVAPSELRQQLNGLKEKECLDPNVVNIISFWNEQPNLRKHKLEVVGRRTPRYPLIKQTSMVRQLNDLIKKIIGGKFYSSRTEITNPQVKKLNVSMGQVKQAIKRFNLSGNSEFNEFAEKVRNTSIDKFFYNSHGTFKPELPETTLYKYRFPFLHYLLNKPTKTADRPFPAKTNHPAAVAFITKQLRHHDSNFKATERECNEVVRHVDVAVSQIVESANGSSGDIIKDLGTHIVECMRANGPIRLDSMFKVVKYKLVPYLRERRYL